MKLLGSSGVMLARILQSAESKDVLSETKLPVRPNSVTVLSEASKLPPPHAGEVVEVSTMGGGKRR
jgi:hypothetical protein